MKIGEQATDYAELEPRVDEQVCRAGSRDDLSAVVTRHRFQRPRRGRTDRDHAFLPGPRTFDDRRRRGAYFVVFRIQTMIFDALDSHWLKRAIANVQRNLGRQNATSREALHDLWCEVESC